MIAQEGPGHCREEAGQHRVHLAPNEKLVGFKFFTDHCTCVSLPHCLAPSLTWAPVQRHVPAVVSVRHS